MKRRRKKNKKKKRKKKKKCTVTSCRIIPMPTPHAEGLSILENIS